MASTAHLRALYSTPRTWPLHFTKAGPKIIHGVLRKLLCYHTFVVAIFAALMATLYIKTLHYPLVFDDQLYLERNPLFKDPGNYLGKADFYDLATRATALHLDIDISTNFLMRPLTYLTFYANYATSGMNAAAFRWVNFAIHFLNALLLYAFVGQLIKRIAPEAAATRKSAWFIASACAALFLVHPLQTESVTYVVQRFTSMSAFFYLLTLLAHLRSHMSSRPRRALAWRVVSCGAFILGALSKETIITAAPAIVLMDWWLLGSTFRAALVRARYLLLLTAIIPLRLLMISWCQNEGSLQLDSAYNIANSLDRPVPAFPYCLTQFSVLLSYLKMLLWPSGQHVDHSVVLFTSIFQWGVWRSALSLCGVLLFVGWLRRFCPSDGRGRLILAGVVWFLVCALVPVGLVPLPDAMAEHRAYLPSMFLFLGVACALDVLRTRLVSARPALKWGVPILVCAWVAALVVCTSFRNDVWSKGSLLWRDSVTKSPAKARAWYNLAMSLREEGRLKEAVPCLQEAVRIEKPFLLACLNLGAYEASLGETEDAIAIYEQGVKLQPKASDLFYNLGVLYYQTGRLDSSVHCFEKSIHNAPYHCLAHRMLGKVFVQRRQYDLALRQFRIAEMLAPHDRGIHQTVLNLEALRFQPGGIPGFFSLK